MTSNRNSNKNPLAKPGPVKHPLTPSVVSELGALRATPLPIGPARMEGDWARTYRIWTCYGHRDRGNRDQGNLTIRRSGNSAGKSFRLGVEQTLYMDPKKDRYVNHVSADIHCRSDKQVSPTFWTFSSRFTRGLGSQEIREGGHTVRAGCHASPKHGLSPQSGVEKKATLYSRCNSRTPDKKGPRWRSS